MGLKLDTQRSFLTDHAYGDTDLLIADLHINVASCTWFCYRGLHCTPVPVEWPPFSLPYLVKPNCTNQLQDVATVPLQLVEGATSGVVVFKTSLRVEEGS